MSKKHVAFVIAGAVVVASAAYLYFRSKPKKRVPTSHVQESVVPTSLVQESVEELKVKAGAGDTSAMCRLALLHLKPDDVGGVKQDVSYALELLRKAAENGGVEAMMCDNFETLSVLPQLFGPLYSFFFVLGL
jgi:TPR repeat protein